MEDGIDPPTLLLLKSKWVKFGNEENSNSVSVPERDEFWRVILETRPPSLQTIPVQLQTFWMFLEDHEFSKASEEDDDDDNKVRFHLTRASACVVDVDMVFNGRKESKAI